MLSDRNTALSLALRPLFLQSGFVCRAARPFLPGRESTLPYPPVLLQTIHLQTTTPRTDFGEARFSPVPFSRGLGEASQFGSLPTTCLAQRGDLEVSARHRLCSGAGAEGNSSAWDCCWPHAGLYPKHLHLRQSLTCPLPGLPSPCSQRPVLPSLRFPGL